MMRRSAAPLVATWMGVAVGVGLLLAVARAAQGPLDDADQARQRPGFLDAGDLPAPAPILASGIPEPGRPTLVFFVPAERLDQLCRALGKSSLPKKAAMAIVVAAPFPRQCDAAQVVVGDPDGLLAEEYGVPRPRGGGPPLGYAVVDAAGAIRYRTLDPEVADQLDEVATIVAALP